MKRKMGLILVMLGLLLIAAALGLFLFNRHQEERAAQSVASVIPQVVDAIYERQSAQQGGVNFDPNWEMPVSQVDGYDYIGFLFIPALQLELPVMADWSEQQLQIAPCRYSGSLYSDDLVLMAHNYKRHFGKISKLHGGDLVSFTDMDGNTTEFEVTVVDVLPPTAIEEMTAGEYDLTLFTCTYGGNSRVTLRCTRLE